MTEGNYIVISVSTATQRDKVIEDIYKKVAIEPEKNLTIQRDSNKIRIFHNVGNGVRVPVRTYLIVLIPIQINLQVLTKMTGSVYFHLDETIEELSNILNRLQKLNGKQVLKTAYASQTFDQLVQSLTDSLS